MTSENRIVSEDGNVYLSPAQCYILILENAIKEQASRLARMDRSIKRSIEEFEFAQRQFQADVKQFEHYKEVVKDALP